MKERRSSLYLTELILNLCIFLICAVVCVGLLLRARYLSQESRELTRAVALAQTAAETLRGSGIQTGTYTSDALCVSYACTSDGSVINADIKISDDDGRQIYSLAAAWPEEDGT